MKRAVHISILYFILHIIFSIILTPFMISFGSGAIFKKIILVFINFPMRYYDKISDEMFILNYLINSLFWSFILFIILIIINSTKNSDEKN